MRTKISLHKRNKSIYKKQRIQNFLVTILTQTSSVGKIK